jgi:hypothetical protein
MKITSKLLRQIIREELVREAYGDQSYYSYFALKRVVDWALRTQMDMAGNKLIGARDRMMNEMFQMRGESTVLIPPPELFAPIRDKLLATPKVSAVVMDTDMGAEMSGAFRLTVVGCPGWPTSMTHDDFYKVAQFINRSPAYSELIAAYEAVFGDGEGPDDVPDEELALTRGFVFMMVDLILASAPKGHTAFYVNEVDMEIGVWKPSHPVPKGLTMASLLGAGGMRGPAVDRRPERLDVLDMPRAPVGDDFNEGRIRSLRARQIIREEVSRLLNKQGANVAWVRESEERDWWKTTEEEEEQIRQAEEAAFMRSPLVRAMHRARIFLDPYEIKDLIKRAGTQNPEKVIALYRSDLERARAPEPLRFSPASSAVPHYPDRLNKMVLYYTSDRAGPYAWRTGAREEYVDMAAGGDAGGIRDEYYADWTDSDFQDVIDAVDVWM